MTTYILKYFNTELNDYLIVKGFLSRIDAYNYVTKMPHDFYQIFPME